MWVKTHIKGMVCLAAGRSRTVGRSGVGGVEREKGKEEYIVLVSLLIWPIGNGHGWYESRIL